MSHILIADLKWERIQTLRTCLKYYPNSIRQLLATKRGFTYSKQQEKLESKDCKVNIVAQRSHKLIEYSFHVMV